MICCTLFRMDPGNASIRTEIVEGWTSRLPVLGAPFAMTAPPISETAEIRLITTSSIAAIRISPCGADQTKFIIRTETGSNYVVVAQNHEAAVVGSLP